MPKHPTLSDFPPHLRAQIAEQIGGGMSNANHGWGNQPPTEKKKMHTPTTGNKWKKAQKAEENAHFDAKNTKQSAKIAHSSVIKYIGIDSGTHTGIAVWNKPAKKFELIKTVKIHVAMEIVQAEFAVNPNILVRVEDARQRKWFGNDDKKTDAKKQGAGSVKRDAVIWRDFLIDHKIPHEMVPPQVGGTKLSKEEFAMLTRYTGLTSNHARDAGMMVYNY